MLRVEGGEGGLSERLEHQLAFVAPEISLRRSQLDSMVRHALEACEPSFSVVANRYYRDDDGHPRLDPLHSVQYATFLYHAARAALQIEDGPGRATNALYCLNKALHGIDIWAEVELPAIFLLEHCVGTVLGRARYADHLVVYQNVTVGGSLDLAYPTIGPGVALMPGAHVSGDVHLEGHSWVSAGAVVRTGTLPQEVVIEGTASPPRSRPARRLPVDHYFLTGP